MKSPWQFGLLAVAVMGVSTYDYVFFTNNRSSSPESALIGQTQPSGMPGPLLAPPISSPKAGDDPGSVNQCAVPPISLEALRLRSQQAYAGKSPYMELENAWPRRDPFKTEESSIMPARKAAFVPALQPPVREAAPASSLAEPQCLYSGALIEQDRRLALVNGMPIAIGDRLGDWRLTRIEMDYIILEADKETRRIEQKAGELQSSPRKDAL
jgi:hypothetical protein